MKALFDNLRLRTKLLLTMLLLLVLSLAGMFILYTRAERALIAKVQRHTADLSTAIQISVEQITSKERTREARLQDYVRRLEQRGVKEVSIVSNEQTVIASSNPTRIGARVVPQVDPKRKDQLISVRLGEEQLGGPTQRTYNLLIPMVVGNRQSGYILLSMILDDFAEYLRANLLRRIVATLAIFAVGIAAALVLSWTTTQPIRQVVQAAKRVAAGDLETPLPVDRRDEVGELNRAFNEMQQRLKVNKALEERLHQAERLSTIGQLASGIAHEIRNPLNFINLSVDHLQSRYRPPEQEAEEFDALVTRVKGEIHRLNTMITNFLTFGKPLALERRPCNLIPVLEDVLGMVAQKAAEQDVEIVRAYPAHLPRALADQEQIRTCLLNLVINALQAMPKGGRLTVWASGVSRNGTVEITIADSGHGIAPEVLPLVWEPYFTTKEVGIGLGLALTKKIVDEHQGSIAIASTPDVGTEVRVSLPRAET